LAPSQQPTESGSWLGGWLWSKGGASRKHSLTGDPLSSTRPSWQRCSACKQGQRVNRWRATGGLVALRPLHTQGACPPPGSLQTVEVSLMARGRSPKCSLTLCRVVNASGAHEQSLQETLVSTTEALPSFTSATTHKPSESLITGIYQCHHTPCRRKKTPIEPSMMREDDVTNATNDETIAKGAKKASNDSPASEHWGSWRTFDE